MKRRCGPSSGYNDMAPPGPTGVQYPIAMSRIAAVTSLTIALFVASRATAQNTPRFFGGGVVASSPTISTVSSGAVFDAQATVSYDRKYVTIGAQAQDSRLIALRDFQVTSGIQQGFVGGVNPGGGAAGG